MAGTSEADEKQYLRNAFIIGAMLVAMPLAYGSFRGFPRDFYIFFVPPLAGLLVIVYALENSIRRMRTRIEGLEDYCRDQSERVEQRPAHRPFDPGRMQ